MKCFSPYFRYMPNTEYKLPFPCGRCLACRYNKRREWLLRITMESFEHEDIGFLTLTYDNDNIPDNEELSPHALCDFLKRLRYYLPYKIRYYACGEYGDKYGRPHYHLIVFGLSPNDFDYVRSAWSYGFVKCEVPRSRDYVAAYVSGYVTKKIGSIEQQKEYYGGRYTPFQRCSLGLGKAFLDRLPCYTPVLRLGKYTYVLGRYLRNKLAERFGILEQVKEEGLQRLSDIITDVVSCFDWTGFVKSPFEKPCIERLAWQQMYAGNEAELVRRDEIHNKRSGFT